MNPNMQGILVFSTAFLLMRKTEKFEKAKK